MLEPITLAGTVVGVTLNSIFPQWLVTILLVALLAFTARKTINKGLSTYQKESKLSAGEMRKVVSIWHPQFVTLSETEVVAKQKDKLSRRADVPQRPAHPSQSPA